MFVLDQLQNRLRELGIQPNKALGQNFLVREAVIERILSACEGEYHQYIEIGPGPGALTEGLLARSIKPRVVEMDRKIASYWKERGLEVFTGDALRMDWTQIATEPKVCLVSNLPYQISSSILIDRCIGPTAIACMVLMFQKEVAERIEAPAGSKDYGILSVMAQTFWQIERVSEAGPKDFFPPPKVASRVLKFQRKDTDVNASALLRLCKAAFAQRRKKLTKNLASLNLEKAALEDRLQGWGHPLDQRAEQLSPEQFAALLSLLN